MEARLNNRITGKGITVDMIVPRLKLSWRSRLARLARRALFVLAPAPARAGRHG